MSKAMRITIFAASILLAVGIGLWVVGASRSGSFLPVAKAAGKVEQKELIVEEAFDRIVINEISADVELQPAADGVCRIFYSQTEREPLEVSVKNGTLTVERKSKKNFGLFSIGDELGTTTLYLPETVCKEIELYTVSGDIRMKPGVLAETLTLETVSGDVTLSKLALEALSASTVSGDVRLNQLTASAIGCGTTSGEIILDGCDAKRLELETVSGDVTATLLTAKAVSTSTVSGDVSVPNTRADADPCHVETVSGNIRVETP